MPLLWNEIRHRAIAFSREWQGETREAAEGQFFWNEFFKMGFFGNLLVVFHWRFGGVGRQIAGVYRRFSG